MVATTESPAIVVETIAIAAPITAVFAALTIPEQVAQWWGSDDSYRVREMQADVRTGGAWKSSGVSRDGSTFTVSGKYRIVEPPHLVEFTWLHDWSDDSDLAETIVRYELEESDGVTRLTVRHSGFTTVDDRDGHEKGWKTVLGWVHDFVMRAT